MVIEALGVDSQDGFNQWHVKWQQLMQDGYRELSDSSGKWAQFVIRAVDERGDPIKDYHLQMFSDGEQALDFDLDVATYKADPSFSCYHVNLNDLNGGNVKDLLNSLHVRVIASSGSQFVTYHGYNSDKTNEKMTKVNKHGKWDAKLDFSKLPVEEAERFFRPFSTTLIELKLNREPVPLDVAQANLVCRWDEGE